MAIRPAALLAHSPLLSYTYGELVEHRGSRAVPHLRVHREVRHADLPGLTDGMGMDTHRRTGADRTRPPGREAAPLPRRRGQRPVAAITDPAPPEVLAELAAARADEMGADTVNREVSIARKAIGWWQRQGWIECDPTLGVERRPATPCARPGLDSVARHVARHPADRVGGKEKAAQRSDLPAPNSTDGSHGGTSDLLAADGNRAEVQCPPSPTVRARNAVDASSGQWAAPSSPAPDGSRRRARRPRR
ncbi:hypothetical protein ACWEV4_18335 [Streptomyces sp. NPDC003860]